MSSQIVIRVQSGRAGDSRFRVAPLVEDVVGGKQALVVHGGDPAARAAIAA
jgi:hypothetical protein